MKLFLLQYVLELYHCTLINGKRLHKMVLQNNIWGSESFALLIFFVCMHVRSMPRLCVWANISSIEIASIGRRSVEWVCVMHEVVKHTYAQT